MRVVEGASSDQAAVEAVSLPPGAELAGALDALIPFAMGDRELIEALRAFRRLTSWAQAGELAVIAELGRRRPPGAHERLAPGSACAGEFLVDEVEATLTLTGTSAAYLVELAMTLAERLPATLDALRAGLIDSPKAKVIAQGTAATSPEVAAQVESRVLGKAPEQTTSQLRSRVARAVIAADPDAADRRREAAEARRDVHCGAERDGSGTATISGRHLPADQAVAAANRLNAIARGVKADGDARPLGAIRADVLLAMMLGLLPADLQPQPRPPEHCPGQGVGSGAGPEGRAGRGAGSGGTAEGRAGRGAGSGVGPERHPGQGAGPSVGSQGRDRQGAGWDAGSERRPGEGAGSGVGSRGRAGRGAGSDAPCGSRHDRPSDDHRGLQRVREDGSPAAQPEDVLPPVPPLDPDEDHVRRPPDDATHAHDEFAAPVSRQRREVAQRTPIGDPHEHDGCAGRGSRQWSEVDQRTLIGDPHERDGCAGRGSGQWSEVVRRDPIEQDDYAGPGPQPWYEMAEQDLTDDPYEQGEATQARRQAAVADRAGARVGTVNLTIPLTTYLGLTQTPADIPGYGPLLADVARVLADNAAHPGTAWCVTVLDDQGRPIQHGELRYRPSSWLRRKIEARNPVCVFPQCRVPARACDLDHCLPYGSSHDRAITCGCNLQPLCRRHHRLKTAGGWRLDQLKPGHYVWTTPSGERHHVAPEEQPQ